jgi:hypothetical protein
VAPGGTARQRRKAGPLNREKHRGRASSGTTGVGRPQQRIEIVLAGLGGDPTLEEVCPKHDIAGGHAHGRAVSAAQKRASRKGLCCSIVIAPFEPRSR